MELHEGKELRHEPDAAQFEAMLGMTRRKAYSMALKLTRNPTDAEDLVQDTWVKAWRRFDTYMPSRPFLNWLLRIMQRAYLDTRRRENPIRKADSLHSMISPSDGDVQELSVPDTGPSPHEELERQDRAERVRAALAELPDVYRQAVELCDLESMSYSEIAAVQNTTVGTVRSRIHRGRRMLRVHLSKR